MFKKSQTAKVARNYQATTLFPILAGPVLRSHACTTRTSSGWVPSPPHRVNRKVFYVMAMRLRDSCLCGSLVPRQLPARQHNFSTTLLSWSGKLYCDRLANSSLPVHSCESLDNPNSQVQHQQTESRCLIANIKTIRLSVVH